MMNMDYQTIYPIASDKIMNESSKLILNRRSS
jgi:hypothetical protein